MSETPKLKPVKKASTSKKAAEAPKKTPAKKAAPKPTPAPKNVVPAAAPKNAPAPSLGVKKATEQKTLEVPVQPVKTSLWSKIKRFLLGK